MKKLLVAILCFIPLIANAVNVGGFEIEDRYITEKGAHDTYLYHIVNGEPYIGYFNGKLFVLGNEARGKNKFWLLLSAKKGSYIGNNKESRSLLSLVELDCTEYRSRFLRKIAYSDYFAQGKITFETNNAGIWRYQQNEDVIMQLGCALLDSAE
jgi:hypothetical protein